MCKLEVLIQFNKPVPKAIDPKKAGSTAIRAQPNIAPTESICADAVVLRDRILWK